MRFRLGLLGQNIAYSLSPAIHQWGLQQTCMEGDYRLFDVPPSELESVIRGHEWDGLNVTIPFKSAAIEHCSSLTAAAASAGAVNCLYRIGERVCGDDFDGAGFLFALRLLNDRSQTLRHALVIGSGGAARAVIGSLTREYSQLTIVIATRSVAAAKAQQSILSGVSFMTHEDASRNIGDFDLIIQATSVGSGYHPGFPLSDTITFSSHSLVMDLIYAPRKTEFLARAHASGARTMNGLPMLLGQAAASFERWTSQLFPVERAVRELLPQLENS